MKVSKGNKLDLAKAARECASIAESVSGTIYSIVQHWNQYCHAAELTEFTTNEVFTRRAKLADFMRRMAETLESIADNKTTNEVKSMKNTIKTTLHTYSFYIDTPEGAAAWKLLSDKLRSQGLSVFESHGGGSHYLGEDLDDTVVELELDHLFNNQWNTAPIPGFSDKGYRVFDWALDYNPYGNPNLKRGHYLEQTGEMDDVRRNTHKCGYCGKMEPAAKGYVFCPHCLDSQYLTFENLKLTRMVSVKENNSGFQYPELSDAEKSHLIPLFKEAQLKGGIARNKSAIAKKLEDLEKTRDAVIKHAGIEYDGFKWFLDRGINTDNLIYYKHTRVFCWGWRNPIDDVLVATLLDIVSEFPFNYEMICADGRNLKNF